MDLALAPAPGPSFSVHLVHAASVLGVEVPLFTRKYGFFFFYALFSPAETGKQGRSSPPQSKKATPPQRKTSPIGGSLVLHIDSFTRNLHEGHLRERFCDVVIHIFLPEQRGLYDLEEFNGNAKSIDLAFENQPPLRG